MECLVLYIKQYKIEKAKKTLYERYTANALGVIARFEDEYDDLFNEIENIGKNSKRTAQNFIKDLKIKLNGGK